MSGSGRLSAEGSATPGPAHLNLTCSCRLEPTQEGDYEICFDNSFSHFSEKMVFFEIILEGQGGDDQPIELEELDGNLLEYKLEDIRVSCLPGLLSAFVSFLNTYR